MTVVGYDAAAFLRVLAFGTSQHYVDCILSELVACESSRKIYKAILTNQIFIHPQWSDTLPSMSLSTSHQGCIVIILGSCAGTELFSFLIIWCLIVVLPCNISVSCLPEALLCYTICKSLGQQSLQCFSSFHEKDSLHIFWHARMAYIALKAAHAFVETIVCRALKQFGAGQPSELSHRNQ